MTSEFPPPAALKPNKLKKWIRTRLLSPYLYKIPTTEKTLDIACGWGFSFDINQNFFGLELDDECVQYCQQRGFNVTKGNLLEIFPFESGFFDTCFSHDVLEHFEPDEVDLIFKNVFRVLKPGGLFLNIIPNKKGYDYGVALNVGHKHYVIPSEIEMIAARTGYQYLGSHSVPVPAFMNGWFTHAKYLTKCKKIGS